jgi:hypothetical protein
MKQMGVLHQILEVLLKSLSVQQDLLKSSQHIEELLEAEAVAPPATLLVTYRHLIQ